MVTVAPERCLTDRLQRIAKCSDRASAAAYASECGLSPGEGRCLAALGPLEPVSVKDLAHLPNLDKGNASRAADTLAARGLLHKAASATDGRGVALTLTREGRSVWRRVMRLIEQREQQIFDCLGDGERATLDALLDRVRAHVEGLAGG